MIQETQMIKETNDPIDKMIQQTQNYLEGTNNPTDSNDATETNNRHLWPTRHE